MNRNPQLSAIYAATLILLLLVVLPLLNGIVDGINSAGSGIA